MIGELDHIIEIIRAPKEELFSIEETMTTEGLKATLYHRDPDN